MRLPTFSRQSSTTPAADDHTATPVSSTAPATPASSAPPATSTAPVGERRDGSAVPGNDRADETTATLRPVPAERSAATATMERVKTEHAEKSATSERTAAERAADRAEHARAAHDKPQHDKPLPPAPVAEREPVTAPVVAGPKPRASLLATLGLITGVASALLVLSGPLAGYGVGLAGLALILSLGGISATGRRHVAGKSDAIIGMVLALGAIVIGVLALTGSLSWLGTDMQPVNSLREWLDTQFADIF